MLRYIRTLLEVEGYKVETASTGEEDGALKKGSHPDWSCASAEGN
jgi:hypothetical protein